MAREPLGHSQEFWTVLTYTEPRVIIDAGAGVQLGAVLKIDATNHVHLPRLHGVRALPSLVIRLGTLALCGIDERM